MDKQELKEALISLGIKPRRYTIDGESYKDSSWVLDISFNRFSFIKKYKVWHVFHFERGQRYEEKTFHTEDDACRYIYEKIKHSQEIINKFKLEDWSDKATTASITTYLIQPSQPFTYQHINQ